jgi:hypothetical protein
MHREGRDFSVVRGAKCKCLGTDDGMALYKLRIGGRRSRCEMKYI